ncbi:RNA polymerase sigma factor SigJ [Microbacterium binotii]|uniref:RNA polymerase sigma factor SigJ n=1 Tax=Microbacterium binotii TaxID=462710 RepID=UPI001F1945A8|nr:RNA polymerase sigma factor SigJ [Microbacterium binotii]UIN31200.1 RNA polymerase sigma factor SigJ [Microbacterium binotii]
MRDVEDERVSLVALAYRMLGDVGEAEDAVQEAYLRWVALSEQERAAIDRPGAWLNRVTSRICLDVLGSARSRRERYVGPWLPEPVPASGAIGAARPATDPLDSVTLDDSVSLALQIVLDAMTPAERVAFVMHDVFGVPFAEIAETVGRSPAAVRQLAASARRKVGEERDRRASRAVHDQVVMAFAAACASGRLEELVVALDPGVVLTSDGGGRVSAARRPVVGADNVARFVLGILAKQPDASLEPVETGDGLGYLLRQGGEAVGLAAFGVDTVGRIVDIWLVRNPDKLRQWA